jgi:hypothetical protein
MTRRRFARVALPAALLLIGCDTEQKSSDPATLPNNNEMQNALKSLADAIDDLVGDVGDFDTKSLRDVGISNA